MTTLFEDLQWRGLIHTMSDPSLETRLNEGGMTAYIGFDPTATSIHIGNLLQLCTMKRLQDGGHRPIVLAGGATGMIGDPSFKSAERSLLDDETLAQNVAGIQRQLSKVVSFEGERAAIMVNNADWTKQLSVIDFLRDVGKHVTVNTMLSREAVRARLEDREQGISYTEFSYALLQANDYVHLNETYDCTLQIGGSDQWGNILGGVDMVRRRLQKQVFAFCTPLITKADGTKFGKTAGGLTPWLDAELFSPYKMYQFWMQAEDTKVIEYLKVFTFLSRERIEELEAAVVTEPFKREAQRVLAREMTTMIHGSEEADRAKRASEALFSEAVAELDEALLLDVFADAPSADVSRGQLGSFTLIEALVQTGLSPSTSAARKALDQGGVAVNNCKREGLDAVIEKEDLLHDAYVVLRRGKREFATLRFR